MNRNIKDKIILLFLALQLSALSGCGGHALPAEEENIPSMTVTPAFGYLETTTGRTTIPTETRSEYIPSDMTGTELATTFTDEFGNVYGVIASSETISDPVFAETPPYDTERGFTLGDSYSPFDESTAVTTVPDYGYTTGEDLSVFPDIDLSEYYRNTDPVNTFSAFIIEETESYVPPYSMTEPPISVTSPPDTVPSVSAGSPWEFTEGTPYRPSVITGFPSESVPSEMSSPQETIWYAETTAETSEAVPAAAVMSSHELAASRNAVVSSKYRSGVNEVMHTYSYTSLTPTQKYAYDVITAACLEYRDKVSFSLNDRVTFDDLYAAYQMLYLDEVRLYYIDTVMEYFIDEATGYVTAMNLSYIYTKDAVDTMNREMDQQTEEILSAVNGMDEYETVKYIHDEIIKRCTYTLTGSDITSTYGAVVRNKAQCQGYARAFSYFCCLCGIETDIVLGVANEEHMWNMVKINGKWYHIDLTWDDPDKADYPDSIRYDYFCVSSDRMEELRTIEGNSHTLPTADSTDLEYYNYNKLVVSSVDEARKLFMTEAAKAAKGKASTVQFRCSSSEVYEEILEAFFTNNKENNVLDMLDVVNKTVENKINSDSVSHNTNFDTLIIKIFLNYK